jgi:hypothetical protein
LWFSINLSNWGQEVLSHPWALKKLDPVLNDLEAAGLHGIEA